MLLDKRRNMFIKNPDQIKLAILGKTDGNDHPYSWSAIFNGYNREKFESCPNPGIREYISKQPLNTFGIPGAKITHVWTDNDEAKQVAEFAQIPNIVQNAEDVIGDVDAVIIATDVGHEHVERCRPFVEANLPIFVDKPLTDNLKDLKEFSKWILEEKRPILSSSCMHYCKEFHPYRESTANLGELRYLNITMPKTWEQYGIHALEGIYPILGPGFDSVQHCGDAQHNLMQLHHNSGVYVTIANILDMYGAFAKLQICGTKDSDHLEFLDTYYAFKRQLVAFIEYLRSGIRPIPYEETEELMKLVIAGIESRNQNGKKVFLKELC